MKPSSWLLELVAFIQALMENEIIKRAIRENGNAQAMAMGDLHAFNKKYMEFHMNAIATKQGFSDNIYQNSVEF